MKPESRIWLVSLFCMLCGRADAQGTSDGTILYTNTGTLRTVLVTNWVDPSSDYRMVRGQLYNAVLSRKWQWLAISNVIQESEEGGKVHAVTNFDTSRSFTLLTSVGKSSKDGFDVTIFHFRFEPTNFNTVAEGGAAMMMPIKVRVYPMFADTNASSLGGSLIFDYGLPATNKIPVVQSVKIRR